jgi:hypothetical protein
MQRRPVSETKGSTVRLMLCFGVRLVKNVAYFDSFVVYTLLIIVDKRKKCLFFPLFFRGRIYVFMFSFKRMCNNLNIFFVACIFSFRQ